jgi:hypothetical protein
VSLLAVFGIWLAIVLGACAAALVIERGVLGSVEDWFRRRQDRKRARIEAELDRTQAQLRQTILQLASALNGDALEARKALIRESYLARGEVPKE